MIIERRLKYIKFIWDDDKQVLTIHTYRKDEDDFYIGSVDADTGEALTGYIELKKTYLFSTMRVIWSTIPVIIWYGVRNTGRTHSKDKR